VEVTAFRIVNLEEASSRSGHLHTHSLEGDWFN